MAESTEVAPDSTVQWDEADYAPALRHLQTLQDKIDQLRNTIPSMIETFAPPPKSNISPSQMYTDFARASMAAAQDLRSLRASWQDSQTQRALDQARASLEKKDDLDWEFVNASRWHNLETVESIEKERTESKP